MVEFCCPGYFGTQEVLVTLASQPTKTCSIISLYLGAVVLAGSLGLATPTHAKTVSVHCPSQKIQNAIDAAFAPNGASPSLEPLVLNVFGTCTENVNTPPLRLITIIGHDGAVLRPQSASAPALFVHGGVTVRNMTISSTLASLKELIRVDGMDFFSVENSSISSNTADRVIEVFGNSEVQIYNSTIAGGVGGTVAMGNGAHVSFFAGAGGSTSVRSLVEGNQSVIGCYGGVLNVYADSGSTVTIGPAGSITIDARGCTADIGSSSPTVGTIRIIGSEEVGVHLKSGDSFRLVQTRVTGHDGRAIEVNAGVLEIDKTSIFGNGSGIWAQRRGIVRFNDIAGPSSVSGPNRFRCYQEGRIFADPGFIVGQDDVYDDGCLKVGEFDD
jgi:hypothetical protein